MKTFLTDCSAIELTHEYNKYTETDLDPNSHKIHRRSSISMDNQSKKSHCHIVWLIWDCSLAALEVLRSNELYPILNSYPSIVNETRDFSIAIILHPKRKQNQKHLIFF